MFALLVGLAAACHAAWAEPDEERLGKSQNYPVGNAGTWYKVPNRVGAWSAMHTVPGIQTRLVSRATEARLGLTVANDGKVGDKQLINREFLLDAMKERIFAMQGIHGQAVYIQPSTGTVMVLTSVRVGASGRQDVQPHKRV